jgi:pilus assembly protein CpaE
MVYSVRAHRDLAIRCMRAGAREFLNLPLAPDDVAGALARVPLRASSPGRTRPASSKLFVFLGTKGGCGVTRIASRFALSLARDSGKSTLLIDLGLPLGDAALQLGMLCNYSTENALEDWTRLDANFLRTLLAEHVSGLSVLAAPKEFPKAQAPLEAVNKLLDVARSGFHYIVADLGSRLDLRESSLFDESAYLYLVTQAGISDLRNANHLITQLFSARRHRLQVVVNRDVPGAAGCDDDAIERTLSRPVEWRVPDEDATGMGGRPEAIPLAAEDSAVSRSIRQMARSACGLPPAEAQKRGFRFFGSDRRSQAEPEQNSRMASVVASAVVRGERV